MYVCLYASTEIIIAICGATKWPFCAIKTIDAR